MSAVYSTTKIFDTYTQVLDYITEMKKTVEGYNISIKTYVFIREINMVFDYKLQIIVYENR